MQTLDSTIYCISTAVDCRLGLAKVARTCLVYIAPALLRTRSCGTAQDHCCALCSHRPWSGVVAIRGCDRLRLAVRRPSFASCQRKETCFIWKCMLARTCDGGAWGMGLFMKWRAAGWGRGSPYTEVYRYMRHVWGALQPRSRRNYPARSIFRLFLCMVTIYSSSTAPARIEHRHCFGVFVGIVVNCRCAACVVLKLQRGELTPTKRPAEIEVVHE